MAIRCRLDGGVNFAVASGSATSATLCLIRLSDLPEVILPIVAIMAVFIELICLFYILRIVCVCFFLVNYVY